jgi:hypothetical protein
MDTRLDKLIDVFETKGWTLNGSVDVSSDWWFSDILQLSSVWKPVDTVIYLTSLTDPQYLDKKIVWCIGISASIPDNRHYKFIDQVTLNDIKRIDLLSFVDNINKIVLVEKHKL